MRFTITSVDQAPEELYTQTPIQGNLLRQIAGPDRQDYYLAELDRPIAWKKDGENVVVTHFVLTARWAGGVLSPTMSHTPINIAYVVDESVLSDPTLDFKKCFDAAIGVAEGEKPSQGEQIATRAPNPSK